MTNPSLIVATRPQTGHDVVGLAMGSNFQTMYISLFTKNNAKMVLNHETYNGGVLSALREDLGVVGGPEVPI